MDSNYEILGLDESSTLSQIKRKYKALKNKMKKLPPYLIEMVDEAYENIIDEKNNELDLKDMYLSKPKSNYHSESIKTVTVNGKTLTEHIVNKNGKKTVKYY